jgi:hypothetical protein
MNIQKSYKIKNANFESKFLLEQILESVLYRYRWVVRPSVHLLPLSFYKNSPWVKVLNSQYKSLMENSRVAKMLLSVGIPIYS